MQPGFSGGTETDRPAAAAPQRTAGAATGKRWARRWLWSSCRLPIRDWLARARLLGPAGLALAWLG